MNQPYIYKILTAPQWQTLEKEGRFPGAPIDLADGYMHYSAREQVNETVRLHFAGQTGLVIVEVETAPLGDTLKWEASRGGALFPHVYGELTLDQVHSAWPYDEIEAKWEE